MAHARLSGMRFEFPELMRRGLCEVCGVKQATRIVRDMTLGRGTPTRHVCKLCGKGFVNTEVKKTQGSLMIQRF